MVFLYNYQYKKDYNDSLAIFTFTFEFINTYCPLFYAAFISRSYSTICTLLIVEMGFKMLLGYLQEFAIMFYYCYKKRAAQSGK
jgi:hypothetical protein